MQTLMTVKVKISLKISVNLNYAKTGSDTILGKRGGLMLTDLLHIQKNAFESL